jgi:hypothetical protein
MVDGDLVQDFYDRGDAKLVHRRQIDLADDRASGWLAPGVWGKSLCLPRGEERHG